MSRNLFRARGGSSAWLSADKFQAALIDVHDRGYVIVEDVLSERLYLSSDSRALHGGVANGVKCI